MLIDELLEKYQDTDEARSDDLERSGKSVCDKLKSLDRSDWMNISIDKNGSKILSLLKQLEKELK